MKRKAIFMLIFFSLMSTLLLPTIPMSATSTDVPKVAMSAEIPERSVTYEFYDFFDVEEEMAPLEAMWDARYEWEYMDERYNVQSWTYPVVYSIENTKMNSSTYYSGCRLKINATGIQDINMTTPVKVGPPPYDPTKPPVYEIGQFLPYNLTGGLEPGVTGGTADISLWCAYISLARCRYWDQYISYDFESWYDGWQTEFNGTITLDKNAAMEVLGITSAQYDDIENWWNANGGAVEAEWEVWATYLGEWWPMIVPMYSNWLFTDVFWVRADFSQLPDKLVLNWWIAGWAGEAFMARFLSWGPTAIMPGFEGWYHNLNLTASIGPEYSNILVDTIVDYALVCVSLEPYGNPAWVLETVQGDKPALAHEENFVHERAMNHTWSDAYAYYKYPNGTYKKYYTLSTGSINYDDYTPYAGVTGVAGYTPEAWDLREGETLIFNFGNTINNPVWGWKQGTWGAGQVPNDNLTKFYGVLELGYMEPYPEDLGAHYNYDPTNKILTITGSFNMTDWSKTTYPSYWARLADPQYAPNGLLPGGCPFIYFYVAPPEVSVSPSYVKAPPPYIGESFTVNITVSDVFNLWSWQAGMSFNASVLQCISFEEGPFLKAGGATTWVPGTIDNVAGIITPYSCTRSPYFMPVSGSGTLATITFNVTGLGTSDLHLNATLLDQTMSEIPNVAIVDGFFANIEKHDVTVTSVTPSPTEVNVGDSVYISVTVKNEGTYNETFDITAYYDSVAIGPTRTVTNLEPGKSKTLIFTWDTTGVSPSTYTISANASVVPGETDTADNAYIDGTVSVHVAPVADFTYSPTAPFVGETVTFNASASYDPDGTIESYTWDFGDGTSPVTETDPIATHVYTAAETYPVVLTVTDNDNLTASKTAYLTVKVHDVAVTSVTPSPTEVNVGDSVYISVTVKNEGTYNETFDVTVYYDNTEIGTQTVTSLASGATKTLNFTWDTTDVDKAEYTIKAVAETVTGETDTTDNTYTDGTVTVKAPAPAISMELIIGIVIIVIIVVAAAAFLYMKRKTPRT